MLLYMCVGTFIKVLARCLWSRWCGVYIVRRTSNAAACRMSWWLSSFICFLSEDACGQGTGLSWDACCPSEGSFLLTPQLELVQNLSQHSNQATGWTIGKSMIDSQQGQKFSHVYIVQTGSGFHPSSPLARGEKGTIPSAVKRLRCEADQPPRCSVEFRDS
jgi:hypothetical protein